VELGGERRAEARSCPNGFSTTTRAVGAGCSRREPGDHGREQRRRDLEVVGGRLAPPDRLRHALERAPCCEKSPDDVGERSRSAEDLSSIFSPVASIASSGVLAQVLDRPVVDRDADDRAIQQAARSSR
jgi:hypothetical protein